MNIPATIFLMMFPPSGCALLSQFDGARKQNSSVEMLDHRCKQETTVDDNTPTIDPRRSALLVMDYQTGIVGRTDDADELLARMRATIDLARARGLTIGYVRVALTDEERETVPERNKSFSALGNRASAMHADAPETAVHGSVAPDDDDIVVRKQRVGPFSTTDLAEQLADRGIDTLVLAGISTSGVVLSTVRHAADADYRIYVLSDVTADPDPEVHQLLISKVFPRQAWVITSDELAALVPA
jgi:nicotinamidase-related amidase